MGGILRWNFLIWRYLAALMLLPLAVALVLSVLLRPPGPAVWTVLTLLWPVAVIWANAALGGRRIRAELAASGAVLGVAAVLVPLCFALPLLLVPFALLAVSVTLLGLWLTFGAAFTAQNRRAAFPRIRRSLSAVICPALPADRVMAALRLVPGQDTELHHCGPERDDGWFEVTRKLPHLRHDAMPQRRTGPWPLSTRMAELLPWPGVTFEAVPAPSSTQYARIVEEGRFDQTVAFSDGDGISLSLLRICVTPRLHGCVLRETGWTNTMSLFDWLCAQLQNHGLWSLAARLEHIAGTPARCTPTDGPEPGRVRDRGARNKSGQIPTRSTLSAILRKRLRKLHTGARSMSDALRSRQWR
ncbi:MAG: hypothetical protein EA339_13720 [Rhodobacteraceae bacterium]|nr:MAG: hypothetical protein EA339_13720 [Paracoccaceae bacterium]